MKAQVVFAFLGSVYILALVVPAVCHDSDFSDDSDFEAKVVRSAHPVTKVVRRGSRDETRTVDSNRSFPTLRRKLGSSPCETVLLPLWKDHRCYDDIKQGCSTDSPSSLSSLFSSLPRKVTRNEYCFKAVEDIPILLGALGYGDTGGLKTTNPYYVRKYIEDYQDEPLFASWRKAGELMHEFGEGLNPAGIGSLFDFIQKCTHEKMLSESFNSSVELVRCNDGMYVVKRPNGISMDPDDQFENMVREVQINEVLAKHRERRPTDGMRPLIVPYYGFYLSHGHKSAIAMVFKYIPSTLEHTLKTRPDAFEGSPEVFRAIAQQIIAGVASMHKKQVYHLDLKPDNIYMAELPEGKVGKDDIHMYIADFDRSIDIHRMADRYLPHAITSWMYMPPEALATEIDWARYVTKPGGVTSMDMAMMVGREINIYGPQWRKLARYTRRFKRKMLYAWDAWSMGSVLTEMLTGNPFWQRDMFLQSLGIEWGGLVDVSDGKRENVLVCKDKAAQARPQEDIECTFTAFVTLLGPTANLVYNKQSVQATIVDMAATSKGWEWNEVVEGGISEKDLLVNVLSKLLQLSQWLRPQLDHLVFHPFVQLSSNPNYVPSLYKLQQCSHRVASELFSETSSTQSFWYSPLSLSGPVTLRPTTTRARYALDGMVEVDLGLNLFDGAMDYSVSVQLYDDIGLVATMSNWWLRICDQGYSKDPTPVSMLTGCSELSRRRGGVVAQTKLRLVRATFSPVVVFVTILRNGGKQFSCDQAAIGSIERVPGQPVEYNAARLPVYPESKGWSVVNAFTSKGENMHACQAVMSFFFEKHFTPGMTAKTPIFISWSEFDFSKIRQTMALALVGEFQNWLPHHVEAVIGLGPVNACLLLSGKLKVRGDEFDQDEYTLWRNSGVGSRHPYTEGMNTCPLPADTLELVSGDVDLVARDVCNVCTLHTPNPARTALEANAVTSMPRYWQTRDQYGIRPPGPKACNQLEEVADVMAFQRFWESSAADVDWTPATKLRLRSMLCFSADLYAGLMEAKAVRDGREPWDKLSRAGKLAAQNARCKACCE